MRSIQTGDVVGDYRVIEIAGSGGMGAVYKIEHIITKRVEAMKLLPPGSNSDPEQVQRFEREIQVQARLHHPNIVELYNAVRDGNLIGLVMEFVEGESLQHMMESGPISVEAAVDFTCQVLRALAYAHDASVIHRDVAPANIIITRDRVAKLTDFGLARSAKDLRLSTSGIPLGSPWYMSPEQVRGNGTLDGRTDLYAMGAVLHEMLTGAKLFEVEGSFALMRAQVEAEPAPPSVRNPKVPAAIDEIVRKALAKDREMRFQSAEEFRLALESVAVDTNGVTEPSSPLEATNVTEAETPARRRGFHATRAAVLMALVPTVLVAGFLTVRYFPKTAAHLRKAESKPQAVAAIVTHDAPAPAVAARVEAEPPVVAPPAPDVPPVTKKRVRRARRTRVSAQAVRAIDSEHNAIRVTGGEKETPGLSPAPAPALRQEADIPEGSAAKADSVEAAEAVGQHADSAKDPEPATTPQEAAPRKAPNPGNRFVRALGKLNPFRKGAAKTPLK
jgi:serine/threonine-protein kinase